MSYFPPCKEGYGIATSAIRLLTWETMMAVDMTRQSVLISVHIRPLVLTLREIATIYNMRCEEIIRAHQEGAAADAGFDAGEYSGPAHDRACQDQCERIGYQLASHCGFTVSEIDEAGKTLDYEDMMQRQADDGPHGRIL